MRAKLIQHHNKSFASSNVASMIKGSSKRQHVSFNVNIAAWHHVCGVRLAYVLLTGQDVGSKRTEKIRAMPSNVLPELAPNLMIATG